MNLFDNQNLHIGISTKKDGPMKDSLENRSLFFKNKNLNDKIIISADLVHENRVVIVDDIKESQLIKNCDALITCQTEHLLTITVADCLPIYFYDKNKKVIALAHAGWRGIFSQIVSKVINVFENHYGSSLKDIEVFAGPHIRDCHFEVQNDLINKFKISDYITRDEKMYINLSEIVKKQLFQLGIGENNVNISDECTYCLGDKYFSYRRDKLPELKTMIAYLGLK